MLMKKTKPQDDPNKMKISDKIMIKRNRKLGTEKLLSLKWSIYKTSQIISRMELFFPTIKEENNKIRMSASLLFNTVLQILAGQLGKRTK